jgi:hypothetical protein
MVARRLMKTACLALGIIHFYVLAAFDDFDRLFSSLNELRQIFRSCLTYAFQQAGSPTLANHINNDA